MIIDDHLVQVNVASARLLSFFSMSVVYQSKKATVVHIPECVVMSNSLLEMAAVLPPKSHVTRELFEEIDAPIPSEVRH